MMEEFGIQELTGEIEIMMIESKQASEDYFKKLVVES